MQNDAHGDILISNFESQIKEKILKGGTKKSFVRYKGDSIRLSANLSSEIMKSRLQQHNMFKVLKEKKCNQEFHIGENHPSKIKGEYSIVKTFLDKQKWRVCHYRMVVQEMLKEVFQA